MFSLEGLSPSVFHAFSWRTIPKLLAVFGARRSRRFSVAM